MKITKDLIEVKTTTEQLTDVEVEIVQPETKTIVEGGSANYTGGYGDIPVRTGMWLGELEQNETYRLKFHDLIVNGENKGDEFEVEITREQLAIGYDFGEYRYFRLLNQDPYAYVGTESDVEEGSYPISFSAFVVTTI